MCPQSSTITASFEISICDSLKIITGGHIPCCPYITNYIQSCAWSCCAYTEFASNQRHFISIVLPKFNCRGCLTIQMCHTCILLKQSIISHLSKQRQMSETSETNTVYTYISNNCTT